MALRHSPPPPPSSADDVSRAVRALVAASLGFSLMSLCARLAGATISLFEVVFFRALVSVVLSVWMLRRLGVTDWRGTRRGLLLWRGIFGFVALSCFFYSVIHLPLAEATVIQFTSPIFTGLLASIFLREKASARIWIAIGMGLVGVTLITRPGILAAAESSALPTTVVLIGLAGAFLTSCAQVTVRRLTVTEHELIIVLHFQTLALVVGLAAAAPAWRWPTPLEWAFLLGAGLAGQVGQIGLTRGLKHVEAAAGTVLLYLQIVFASLWGLIFLGERPDTWTIGGSLLVLGGIVTSARRPRMPG